MVRALRVGFRWLLGSSSLVFATSLLAPGCVGDEESDDSGEQKTGIPCTPENQEKDCGPLGWCMTAATVQDVSEGDIVVEDQDIPDGYCSQLNCRKSRPTEVCGDGAYCYDLKQYLPDNPIGLCGKTCSSDSDCRDGYVCHDGALTYMGLEVFQPLPFKACLPPKLLCLLDIAQPQCPDVVPLLDGGVGDSGGAGDSGGGGEAAADSSAGDGG